MAHVKTVWDEATAITPARLNNLEGQYDEAVAYANAERADGSKPLLCEIVATLAGETPTAGRIVDAQDAGKFYGGTGSAWRVMRSASGDAVAAEVLIGKTFSNDAGDGLTGTLSVIKSIQRGVVTTGTTNTDVNISGVNLDYSIVQTHAARYAYPEVSAGVPNPYAYFLSSTYLRIVVKSGKQYDVAWEVTEFSPAVIQSIQRGVATLPSYTTTVDVTIDSVNTAKAMLIVGDYYASNGGDHARARIRLKDATTIECYRDYGSAGVSAELHWNVVEFK